jgi:hypothetical protein
MQNKKFQVIEEGRLSTFEMSAIHGGMETELAKKCSAAEMHMSCSCPKNDTPGRPAYANCAMHCLGEYITKPCGLTNLAICVSLPQYL